ncbi:L,D-peptidoglycan transpeptidase YkuD (ErfK/YbiS/YcfS/YnhG family) [Arthrobacter sp. PvP023]|uniref:L,D-transpeptidase family protein n=1 Tax=Micrococcaceae TaxID=1268 RepID=UPI001AE2AD44|nr:L,D-transpeptidase family protein [Arthrobacter sp. PvP023]MBP1136296.1 L,D-peptidoglycan transpeptidase YkuD (ErfK/YbiS/YcfS/YnhG family) [Arthrobacter sp. PvP023]
MGEPTSNEDCDAAGLCVQTFVGGTIYYTPSTGAHAVLLASGKTGPQWTASGGLTAHGYPVTDEACDSLGCFQRYSRGADITWTATGGFFVTHGAIGNAVHRLYGGYTAIGYPTTKEVCNLPGQGCSQEFGNLNIVWSAASGAYGVWEPGAIGGHYAANGAEGGRLGYPLSREICGLRAGGCYQVYQGGVIVWSPASGPRLSLGAIRAAWAVRGLESGLLGYPVSEEVCDLPGSGCQQQYQGGTIYWSAKTGAYATNGAIKGRFDGLEGIEGYLGYPLTGEVCNQPNGGCYQWFQGGLIFWSPATGAQPVRGGMKSKYEAMGWHRSYLGYPATPETCDGSACVQGFQGGYVTWISGITRDYRHTECTTLNDGRIKYPTGNANRVTLTFAGEYGQSYATVAYCQRVAGTYVTDWRTDGRVGASGFKPPGVPSGPTRYNYSPTGSYSVTEAFGLGNPGTALPYRTLNPNSRWGGNPWTATYNKYFESTAWVGYDENMWYFATGASHDYRQGAVINYNRPPDSEIVHDAGFAIFLHEHKVPTAGCIALDDWAVEDFLRKSTPGDRIIMGVARDIFR